MANTPRCELILGGQKSGKSRLAESRARDWLATDPARRAVLLATGWAGDDEMRARIERHQRERAQRVPGMATVEEPRAVAAALRRVSAPDTLIVVDCLTDVVDPSTMPPAGPAAGGRRARRLRRAVPDAGWPAGAGGAGGQRDRLVGRDPDGGDRCGASSTRWAC
jgi:hypothetical protein